MKLDANIAAVVTGGTSGLGAAAARRLASHGVRVAIFGRNTDAGTSLAREIGGVFCQVDVTSETSVAQGFDRARAAIGQERILVNCAGTAHVMKSVARGRNGGDVQRFPSETFDRVVQVNLVGTFRCTTHSLAGMLGLEPGSEGERGVIVHTASIAAQDGQMGHAAYAASKAGIVGMTLPMARDLMSEGIRVNTIMPGIFDTPMLNEVPEGMRTLLAATIPFPRRLGQATEYAALVEAIVTNTYLNGECIRLDGGLRMPAR